MKRQFNFRFFAVLLGCLAVLGVVGHQVQKRNVQSNASYLLQRAKESLARKESVAAQRYFNHYLTLNPQDAMTRARLGVVLARDAANAKEAENAYLVLERALREDPQLEQKIAADSEIAAERASSDLDIAKMAKDLSEVRLTTVRTAMTLRLYSDAIVHIEKLLAARPNDSELLVLRGSCQESSNHDDLALKDYTTAIEKDPSRIEAYAQKARVLQRQKEMEQADKVVGDMLEHNQTTPARLMATAYYLDREKVAEARKQLEEAKKQSADEVEVLLATVRVANSEGKPSEAESALRRGLEKHPDRHEFRLGAASQELEAGRRDQAIELLRKAEAAIAKPSMELWTVADVFIDAAAWEDADKVLIRLRSAKADIEAIEFLEARLHLGKGSVREAESRLLRCERAFPKNSDLGLRTQLLLAECYSQSAKPDLQLKAARRAIDLNGTSVAARMALANALLASGMNEEAKDEYRTVMNRDPRYRAYLSRLVLMETIRRPVGEQNFDGALKLLREAPPELRKQTDFVLTNAEVLLFDGAVMVRRGQPNKAVEPDAAGRKLVEAGRAKIAEARKTVEQARDANPKEARFWVFLAERAAAEGKPEDGLAILDQARTAVGDRVVLRLARAALMKPNAGNVEPLLALESNVDQLPERDRSQLYLGLASIHEQIASAGHPERLIRLAHQLEPNNLRILTRLLEVVSAKENADEIGALVQPIRDAEGEDGALWRFAAAFQMWLSHLKVPNDSNVPTARKLLVSAGESRPKWYRIPLLEGEIADRVGPSDLALEKYRLAFQLGANNPRFVARLTHLLTGRNRMDEAEQICAEYRRRTGITSPELDRIETYSRLMRGSDPDDLAAGLKIPEDSKSIEDQLFRGRMFGSLSERAAASEAAAKLAGKDEEAAVWKKKAADWAVSAEKSYRKAVELSPTTFQAWIALVRHMVAAGRMDEARKETVKAGASVAPQHRQQTLGQCYEALGDREKARLCFESAGSDSASQRALAAFHLAAGESDKAVEVLRRLLQSKDDPATVRWARRTLALILLSSRSDNYAKNLEAEQLIRANMAEDRGWLEDERVLAFVYAFRPGARAESIQSLEALFRRMTPTPPEQFMLARLYELDGNWAAANERYLALFSRPGGENRSYLVPYIHSLLRRRDISGAEVWVNRLAAREKGTFALIELQTRLLHAQGMNTLAANDLKKYASESYVAKKDPAVLLAAANVLADLELLDDAESLYRQYVAVAEEKLPGAPLALAEFLARRRNQLMPAITICSAVLNKKVNPEVVARVAVAIVRLADRVTAAEFVEAERVIQGAAAAKPDSLDISISLADLRDAQGRYAEAKEIYRGVISRNNRSTLAMNNLAWLVALEEKNYGEAVRIIDEALRIEGSEGNLLDTRGVILLVSGNVSEATATLVRAVNDEHTAERHFHLAQAYAKGGRLREAGQEMRRARELDLDKRVKYLHRLELPEYENMRKQFPEDR
jgi:thioredoxin-like negative regulator of GroEL